MLCFEGISLMLNIFRGKRDAPQYMLASPVGGQLEHLTAHQEVSGLNQLCQNAMLSLNRRPESGLMFPELFYAI